MSAISFISLCLFSSLTLGAPAAPEGNIGNSPRFLVHILDYITVDYPQAVKDGIALSESEYSEQVEFAATAVGLAQSLPEIAADPNILIDLKKLQQLIASKADPKLVEKAARDVETKVIRLGTFETYPHSWPNPENGKKLYEGNCSSCHGNTGHGDGPSSNNLDPKPADFHGDKMNKVSPFQMYNAIRLGVPGTAMASFDQFSDKEVWDLAFYIAGIRYGLPNHSSTPKFSLAEAATQTDESLLLRTGVSTEDVHGLRTFAPVASEAMFIASTREKLNASLEAYRSGKIEAARQLSISAYLDGIEPVEPALRNRDAALTVSIEQKMMEARNAIDRGASPEQLGDILNEVDTLLTRASSLLAEKPSSALMAFVLSAGIVLREALEAVLILITLLGVIRSLKLTAAARYVHAGWILAVLVGIAAWFFSGWVMKISGAQREVLEGSISALAVVVLLYFGFWLHKHSEIGRWHAFINDLVRSAVDKRKLFVLGAAAFMGVFREAFETVLFLRALVIEVGSAQQFSVGLGVMSSFALVVIISVIAVRTSANLPIRKLFALSSTVMVLLSFILIGKSIHSFQEAGVLPATMLPINVRWDVAGIYPTLETLIPQLILIAGVATVWAIYRCGSRAHCTE